MVLGGIPIRIVLCQDTNFNNIYSYQTSYRDIKYKDTNYSTLPSSVQTITSFHPSISNINTNVILYIENLIFEDDICDPDEATEVLTDLQLLCSDFNNINAIWLEKRKSINLCNQLSYNNLGDHSISTYQQQRQFFPTTSMTEFTNSVNNITTNQLLSTNTISSTLANVSTTTSTIPIATYLPWMFIEFSQLSTVIECGQLLYNKTFQGCKLNTYVYDYIAYLSGVYDDGWKIDTF